MSDLHSQIHDYVESTIERVDVEDVVAAASVRQTDDPKPVLRFRPAWVAVGAALLVVLAVGVPLMFFRSGNSLTSVDQPTTTTPTTVSEASTAPTTPATTQPVPATALPPAMVQTQQGVPLAEAVPGFADTIVMFATPTFHKVYRWDPSEPTPEVILTAAGGPVGLDISGGWLAEIYSDGDLMVYPVPTRAGDSSEPDVVASEVASALWHDTDPGRLAVLTCPDPSSETATLFTLDITTGDAQPAPITSFDQGCEVGDTFLEGFEVGDVFLDQWNNQGVTVNVFNGDSFEKVLIGADGAEIPSDPNTAILPEGPDDRVFDIAAAVGDDEGLRDASWSPDGTRLALLVSVPNPDGQPDRVLRVVDPATGATLVEFPDLDAYAIAGSPAWSSDSRFVLYHYWGQPTDFADGLDDDGGSASLGFYDTATYTITMVPLDEFVDEIRIINGANND